MNIWWQALPVVALAITMPTGGVAEQVASGTWTLETDHDDGDYMLASRHADGQYLICFTSGNVRSVIVAAGPEESRLARGSCTVFVPAEDEGIFVGFGGTEGSATTHTVALGTFSVILSEDGEP